MQTIRLGNEKKYSKKIFVWKRNYIFLFVSSTIICVGFILMSGGGSNDPDFFND